MKAFKELLLAELKPAMGCTEPIAIALAGAAAGQLAKETPRKILIYASGSIIKNANSVFVPASGGRKGILIAATLGVLTQSPDKKLEVLSAVDDEVLSSAVRLIEDGKVSLHYAKEESGVYVKVRVETDNHIAEATIEKAHDNISCLSLDGEIIKQATIKDDSGSQDSLDFLSLESIKEFADTVDFSKNKDLYDRLKKQAEMNTAIAKEGMNNLWGQQVGRTMLKSAGDNIFMQAAAYNAAASDARMGGCELPAMICCGSGNQGITCSVPVVYVAKKLGIDEVKMLRALAFSDLTALYQKQFIGKLSAFCSVVNAASASVSAIAYMLGESFDVIEGTLTNSLVSAGGIVCDGAKDSCALKIISAVNTAFAAYEMAKEGRIFQPLDGIVGKNVDITVRNIGEMAKYGMKGTDDVILNIIIRQAND